MLARLANRLVLCPSRNPLPLQEKSARRFPLGDGELEIVTMRPEVTREPQAFVLKFGGAGGRAERAGLHPAEIWPHLNAEVWAVNYPGYGNSSGQASLPALVAAAQVSYEQLVEIAAGRPIIVTGNSIGCTCALYLAARVEIGGLLLRNPPPLKQLIVGRFGWWNLWLGAGLIACQVPRELDSLRNAAQASAPAVFLTSGQDRVVPPKFQERIFSAYAGPKQRLIDPSADHATPLSPQLEEPYRTALDWLVGQVGGQTIA